MVTIEEVLATKTVEELMEEVPVYSTNIPELTVEKINATIELLKDIEGNNGYVAIAQKVGLMASQVADIHLAIQSKIAAEIVQG